MAYQRSRERPQRVAIGVSFEYVGGGHRDACSCMGSAGTESAQSWGRAALANVGAGYSLDS